MFNGLYDMSFTFNRNQEINMSAMINYIWEGVYIISKYLFSR